MKYILTSENYNASLKKESMVGDTIVCDKCKWSWAKDDAGDDPFTCHKCGNVNESAQSDKLSTEINKAMVKIDDSMSYVDFASAVAKVLRDEYGSHNYEPFMEVLHKELGIK
jgi:hypothetical protein